MNPTELSHALAQRSPPKRLQFIRQIILKQNQARFCEDGIIRMGTLKSIESARMDIGVKMAERLVHKLSLEGILCDKDLFLAPNSLCVIRFDDTQKALTQKARQSLEIIRQKVTQLVPITITTAEYTPLIPEHSTLLTRPVTADELIQLNKTLCLVKGDVPAVYYLTYLADKGIEAKFKQQHSILPLNILDFCRIYVVELIHFGA